MEHFYSIHDIERAMLDSGLDKSCREAIIKDIKSCSEKPKLKLDDNTIRVIKKCNKIKYSNAPNWFIYSIYYVVEAFIKKGYKQTDILNAFGLSNDIFTREKYFNIYSPDFRINHSNYEDKVLDFSESEVDSGKYYT